MVEKLLKVFDYSEILTIPKENLKKDDIIPYGVLKLGAQHEWKNINSGEDIKVAILDTGVPEHQDLNNNNIKSENFTDSNTVYDKNGHQTHVAGTVAANGNIMGVLPSANLFHIKVLNDKGQGQDEWTAKGIEYAIDSNADVINLSLGGYNNFPKTHEAIKKATDKNIIVVAAAGNHGKKGVTYPACYDEVIAVAAVNIESKRANFSAIGEELEVAAAGYEVLSTWLNGEYKKIQGTSMACPAITGGVGILQAKAKLKYNKKLTLEEIRLLLHMMAKPVNEIGRTKGYGYGVFSFSHYDPEELKEQKEQI